MEQKRLAYLDSIRGIAAVMVVYYHAAEQQLKLPIWPVEAGIFRLLVDYFDLGKIAVVLFFAVSGFVIPFSLLKPMDRPLRGFVVSRFFRLYPAYWLSILLAILVYSLIPGRPVNVLQVVGNLTMLQQFAGIENMIGVYWTLQIELVFYAICAGLFYFGFLQRISTALWSCLFFLGIATIMAAGRYWLEIKLPVALPLGLSVMFWGFCWRNTNDASALQLPMRSFVLLTLILLAGIFLISVLAYNRDMGFGETWYRYTLSYYAAIGLLLLLTNKVRISHPAFVYLGLVSYSVYLLGPIAQRLVEWGVASFQLGWLPAHVVILSTVALTLAIASLAYHLVEAPFQQLGKLLAGRVGKGPRVSAAA